jgi:dipeptidyl aminopeptidase/acylaminoacyl peptidase
VLLIHGTEDHVAPIEDVTALAKRLSVRRLSHELLVLNAGHVISAEKETVRALDAEVAFYRKIIAC